MTQENSSARRKHRVLTPDERAKFTTLSRKLAAGGEYSVMAQNRVATREARSAAIIKLIGDKS